MKLVIARAVQVACIVLGAFTLLLLVVAHQPRALLTLGPVLLALAALAVLLGIFLRAQRAAERAEGERVLRSWRRR